MEEQELELPSYLKKTSKQNDNIYIKQQFLDTGYQCRAVIPERRNK